MIVIFRKAAVLSLHIDVRRQNGVFFDHGPIKLGFFYAKKLGKARLGSHVPRIEIGGIIAISEEGKNLLGVPVPEGMVGISVVGGITPFCAVQEENQDIEIKIAEEIKDFKTLSPIASRINPVLS